MTFMQMLFSFQGRIARLPYFGLSVGIILFLTFAVFLSIAAMSSGDGGAVVAGIAILIPVVVVAVWAGLALTVKRLHDMGLPGTHAIWIYCLNLAPAMTISAPAFSAILSLAGFAVSLWLIFSPGNPEENKYGAVPA